MWPAGVKCPRRALAKAWCGGGPCRLLDVCRARIAAPDPAAAAAALRAVRADPDVRVLWVKNGMRDGVPDGGFRVRGECESRGIPKRPLIVKSWQ